MSLYRELFPEGCELLGPDNTPLLTLDGVPLPERVRQLENMSAMTLVLLESQGVFLGLLKPEKAKFSKEIGIDLSKIYKWLEKEEERE